MLLIHSVEYDGLPVRLAQHLYNHSLIGNRVSECAARWLFQYRIKPFFIQNIAIYHSI